MIQLTEVLDRAYSSVKMSEVASQQTHLVTKEEQGNLERVLTKYSTILDRKLSSYPHKKSNWIYHHTHNPSGNNHILYRTDRKLPSRRRCRRWSATGSSKRTSYKLIQKKIDNLLKMSTPSNQKQVRSFLGAINVYKSMRPRRAYTLVPLPRFTGQIPFNWGPACQKVSSNRLP